MFSCEKNFLYLDVKVMNRVFLFYFVHILMYSRSMRSIKLITRWDAVYKYFIENKYFLDLLKYVFKIAPIIQGRAT